MEDKVVVNLSASLWILFAGLAAGLAETAVDLSPAGTSSQPQPQHQQPAYVAKPQDAMPAYSSGYPATHNAPVTYGGYDAGYGVQNPSLYDYMIASNYPNVKAEQESVEPVYPVGSWLPTIRQALGIALKIFSKLGFLALGGAGLLIVGMGLTTLICTFTPICSIRYFNWQGVSQETVRAMLSPEKITATAQFVQQAIDKYQQLQRVVN